MRKILLAGTFAALALTPALAQQLPHVNAAPADPSGQVVGVQPERAAGYPYGAQQTGPHPRFGTFAYVPERAPAYGSVYGSGTQMETPVFGGQYAVSVDGKILGADPDPAIRSDLQRNQDQVLGRGSS